jgi:hypothetical protein
MRMPPVKHAFERVEDFNVVCRRAASAQSPHRICLEKGGLPAWLVVKHSMARATLRIFAPNGASVIDCSCNSVGCTVSWFSRNRYRASEHGPQRIDEVRAVKAEILSIRLAHDAAYNLAGDLGRDFHQAEALQQCHHSDVVDLLGR